MEPVDLVLASKSIRIKYEELNQILGRLNDKSAERYFVDLCWSSLEDTIKEIQQDPTSQPEVTITKERLIEIRMEVETKMAELNRELQQPAMRGI